jgi:hypothetical protein
MPLCVWFADIAHSLSVPMHTLGDLSLWSLQPLLSDAKLLLDRLEALLSDRRGLCLETVDVYEQIMLHCLYMTSADTFWLEDEEALRIAMSQNFLAVGTVSQKCSALVARIGQRRLTAYHQQYVAFLEGRRTDIRG